MSRALLALVVLLTACHTAPPPAAVVPAGERVTFNDQVVRIFEEHCQVCHRPGEVAPFSLTTYRDAYPHRDDIVDAVRSRYMPPWKALPGYGEFADVRRLDDADIALIARWVADGAPEGDPGRLPPPRAFPSGWTFGPPGVVLAMEVPFTVPPRTRDLYRCFSVSLRLPSDTRFIRASEVVPGNRKVVHHVLTFLDVTGRSLELERDGPGRGYPCFGGTGFDSAGGVGGWAPGYPGVQLPAGVAWRIPPRARLVMQVHYNNPGDTAESDLTRIGLHFTTGPFDRRLHGLLASAWNFTIPAGAPRTSVTAWTQAHEDVDWDFDWQLLYYFKRPVALPAGTRIEAQCVFDNSAANLRNPTKPPRPVTAGFETTDEMCQARVLSTARLR